MPIAFKCGCGNAFKAPDDRAGQKTKCPACSASLVVPVGDDFEVVDDEPAPKPVKRAAAVVDEDNDAPEEPRKKKKKKKSTGIERGDWRAQEEARVYAAYKFKRMLYIGAGLGTVIISGIAFAIFASNGMLGMLPGGTCACGVLGGLYCIWQGLSGTFHNT